METKLFEILDRATFIPMLAIQLSSETEAERFLLSRAGYGKNNEDHKQYILLAQINGDNGQITCDPYCWGTRTFPNAHQYIIENWNTLQSGDVIDVEFILGETEEPKKSERFSLHERLERLT